MLNTKTSLLIKSELRNVVHKLDNFSNCIEINSHIMDGIPVIKRTRIPVYIILELIEGGYTPKEILEEYPNLSLKDIHAAIRFASLLTTLH